MRAISGSPPSKSQVGLKETQVLQSYFLACQCIPESDLSVTLPTLAESTFESEIIDKLQLCHDVMAIRLKPLADFECRPGQYLSLLKGSIVRSYSIANKYEIDDFIEVHVRKITDGKMSSYLHNELKVGDIINCRGPMGDCFYHAEYVENDFPILLAGTSTGLAPLEGILIDALSKEHRGDIQLYHGVLQEKDLYHKEKLSSLEKDNPNFHYRISVLKDANSSSIEELTNNYLTTVDKKHLKVYLCGAPELVNKLKVKIFLSGVSSKNIYSDPFIMSGND
jgi:NAD(P)H-flavin reductase